MAKRDDIQAAIELLRASLVTNVNAEEKPVTIGDIWEHLSTHHDFAETTFKTYQHLYRVHVGPRFGALPALSMDPARLTEYRSELRERTKLLGQPGQALRPATRNRIAFLIKTILNWGTQNRLIPHNPVPVVEKERENNIRETVVSETQLEQMLAYADDFEAAYILVLRDSGLRRREGCSVQWSHLSCTDRDPSNWRLYVTWRSAKGSHARWTILTPRTVEAINRLPRTSEFIFPSPNTDREHVSEDHMLVRFRQVCNKAGVKGPDGNITLHDLRRTFATKLGEAGVSERLICKLMGHRSRATIDRYLIGHVDDLKSASVLAERGLVRERTQINAAKRVRGSRK